jgi:hypothetical protein
MERWRQPVKIEAIEPDLENVMTIAGRRYGNENVILSSREDFDRIREGYVCVQCFEPHETPFPEECSLCGFPMRQRQAGRIEHTFKGEEWVGPRESLEDELERLAETDDRRKHEPGSTILLPPGVNLGGNA